MECRNNIDVAISCDSSIVVQHDMHYRSDLAAVASDNQWRYDVPFVRGHGSGSTRSVRTHSFYRRTGA